MAAHRLPLFSGLIRHQAAAASLHLSSSSSSSSSSGLHDLPNHHVFEDDLTKRGSSGSRSEDNLSTVSESSAKHISHQHGKAQGSSTKIYITVRKPGIEICRNIDLTDFNNYDELITELDELFQFYGELTSPENNWLPVYTDDGNNMKLIGGDPWQEFCDSVWKIFIYTSEEFQKMKLGPVSAIRVSMMLECFSFGLKFT